MTTLLDLLAEHRQHAERLSNQTGAAGEQEALSSRDGWMEKPKGANMKRLLQALRASGIEILARARSTTWQVSIQL
jgi:hypothetical protein